MARNATVRTENSISAELIIGLIDSIGARILHEGTSNENSFSMVAPRKRVATVCHPICEACEPNFWLSHLFISRVYSEKGMHAEAVAEAKRAPELSGNSQSDAYRAYAPAKWGKLSEARAVLKELLKLSTERYVPPYNIALVYNGLGKREKAQIIFKRTCRNPNA